MLVVFFFVCMWNKFLIPMTLRISRSSQSLRIALAALKGRSAFDLTQLVDRPPMPLLLPLPLLVMF